MQSSSGKFFDVLLISENFTTSQLGTIVAGIGFASTLFLFTIGKKLSEKYNELLLLEISIWIAAFSIFIGALTKHIYIFIILFSITCLFISFIKALLTSVLFKRFPHRKGEVNGLRKSFEDFGFLLGPMILGYVFVMDKWFTFILVGIIFLIVSLLMFFLKKWLNENLGEVH